MFASTPAVIGKDGIEDVLELQLTNEELALLKLLVLSFVNMLQG